MPKNNEPKLKQNEWIDPKTGKKWIALHTKKLSKKKIKLEVMGYMILCQAKGIEIPKEGTATFMALGVP